MPETVLERDARLLATARAIAEATKPKKRRTNASGPQKTAVRKRAGGVCEGCGSRNHLRVHHIIPVSKGGTNRPGNLKLYCKYCESRDHLKWRIIPPSKRRV